MINVKQFQKIVDYERILRNTVLSIPPTLSHLTTTRTLKVNIIITLMNEESDLLLFFGLFFFMLFLFFNHYFTLSYFLFFPPFLPHIFLFHPVSHLLFLFSFALFFLFTLCQNFIFTCFIDTLLLL